MDPDQTAPTAVQGLHCLLERHQNHFKDDRTDGVCY